MPQRAAATRCAVHAAACKLPCHLVCSAQSIVGMLVQALLWAASPGGGHQCHHPVGWRCRRGLHDRCRKAQWCAHHWHTASAKPSLTLSHTMHFSMKKTPRAKQPAVRQKQPAICHSTYVLALQALAGPQPHRPCQAMAQPHLWRHLQLCPLRFHLLLRHPQLHHLSLRHLRAQHISSRHLQRRRSHLLQQHQVEPCDAHWWCSHGVQHFHCIQS